MDTAFQTPAHRPTPIAAPAPPSATVLLVDDQSTVNEAVQCMIADTDITCHYCAKGANALEMAIATAPTVILQDLIMPSLSGMELVKQFRSHPDTSDIPIIMLSTNDDPQTKAEAFAIGINDYLVKLPDPIELVARLRYHSQAYLNRQARTAALVAQAQAKELEEMLAELRRTQTQLIQTEKLSSLGQMLAGIAHEINNPVNFIFGNLTYIDNYVHDFLKLIELYETVYPDPDISIKNYQDDIDFEFIQEDLLKTLQSTRIGTERIVQIVLSLRNFSRQDHADMKLSNIHEGINSTLLILSHRLKQGIEVHKEYENLPLIECHQAQLNQVFMNILNNAIDALMEQEEQVHKQISIQTKHTSSNQVEVRIFDNGPGIPDSIKSQLFEPFFTTKPVGKGTGLGLSICQQIIKNHQGFIDVVSEPGKGTEFIIHLAIHQPEAAIAPDDETDDLTAAD